MDSDAVAVIDSALARWCQAGREVVSVAEITDVLLDLRATVFCEKDSEDES